jgi:hypothetical protein
MRTITAAQQACLDAGVQADHVRVSVKDSTSTFRDLSTYAGFNALRTVTWAERIDDPHMTCEVTLMRELNKLRFSPYVQASALNRRFDPANSFVPLIAMNREVKVEVAVTPMDRLPASGDWFEVFRGRIDSVDTAKGEDLVFSCRGLSGRLAQQFIKTELVYAYASDGNPVPLRVWEPQIPVAGGSYVLPATRGDNDPGLDKFLACSGAGTTGTTEPIWTTGAGQTDGSATWDFVDEPSTAGFPVEDIMQNILDDNRLSGDAAVTLNTPSSPGWAIRQFIQQRTFTLDAIRTLAGQIGWDLRYKWDSGGGDFKLTFYEPPRVAPSVAHTFAPSDYKTPDTLAVDISDIRNAWRVIYADAGDLWPDGTPKRKRVEVQDSASITKYGELWAEIQEDETSNIDSSSEATTLANAALSDCAEPTAVFGVELMRGFPWTELNDYYTFGADEAHFDVDLSLAITGWTQTFEAGKSIKTKLSLRGLPTAGAQVHLTKTAHPLIPPTKQPNQHALTQFQSPKSPKQTFADVVGGTRVTLDIPLKDKNRLLSQYEIHVYDAPGTPIDDSTLAGVSMGQDLVLPHVIPGQTYYTRLVERGFNMGRLIRGQPTAEQSFVAGRASSGHVHEGIVLGGYPLNGGFETRVDPSGMPDHWTLVAGTFGSDVLVEEGSSGLSGGRYLRLQPSLGTGDAQVASAKFPAINETVEANRYSGLYRLTVWLKNATSNNAANNLEFFLRGYDYAGALVTAVGSKIVNAASKTNHWQLVEYFISVDVDSSIRSIDFTLDAPQTSGQFIVDIDEVRFQYLGTPWYLVGDTSKFTDNYESIPAFTNSWVDYAGSVQAQAGFRKNQFGRVFLKGLIKSGTIGTSAFTLPVGYRPQEQFNFASIDGSDAGARLQIHTDGTVTPVNGSNAKFSLDMVSFETFL